jgi:hypothetical protein
MGLVFAGVMEAGKTTLVAGLVRAGFGYLTDEAGAIERETLLIQPYPKPLSLEPGSWPLFPELEPQADLATDEYKAYEWQVPTAAIRPGALGRSPGRRRRLPPPQSGHARPARRDGATGYLLSPHDR